MSVMERIWSCTLSRMVGARKSPGGGERATRIPVAVLACSTSGAPKSGLVLNPEGETGRTEGSGVVLDPGVGETEDLRLGLAPREYGVLWLGLCARDVPADSLADCRRGGSSGDASIEECSRGDFTLSDICCDSSIC